MMNIRLALLVSVLSLAGCKHADDSAPPDGTGPAGTGTAMVTLMIPVAAAAAATSGTSLSLPGSKWLRALGSSPGRGPAIQSYVSSKTRSVTLSVLTVNGAPPATVISTTVDVGAGSGCTLSGGQLNCSLSIAAPAGNDKFRVSTHAQTGGLGDPISMGEATVAITAGASAAVPVTLLGVVSSVSLAFSPASLPLATAGTFTATISARDVTGDLITGADNYYQPLTVSTTDAGAHVQASPALPLTISSPAQRTITFTYDGAGVASNYAFRIDGAQSLAVNFAFTSNVEHLYVAYQFPAAVYVYDIAPDGTLTGPTRTIAGASTTLNRPTSIAVDDLGRLYVANYGEFPMQGRDVTVFATGANGNVAPVQTLLAGQNPFYVSYGGATFLTHPDPADYSLATVVINYPGPVTTLPNNLGTTQIPPYIEPFATSFASFQASPTSRGLLCVSSVSTYNSGSGSVQCITSPVLWVTGNLDPGTAQIVNGRARNGFYCCAAGLSDIKFLPDGRLVTSNGGLYMRSPSVDTYTIPADLSIGGSILPVASITGGNTNLVSPTSIAYDKQGNFYVGDTGNASYNGSVHVYAAGATGNVSPVRELRGLNYPFGIAIGP
jgi:hypothetical protein